MANIPDTEYITVNANGIFVGGKPATHYRGARISDKDFVKRVFAWMQKQNPEIEEFHIGAFGARGCYDYGEQGNPHGVGLTEWCRLKYKNGNLGAWVFDRRLPAADFCAYDCASGCANDCAFDIYCSADFRSAVFGAAIEKQNVKPVTQPQNPELKKLEQVDFAKLPKNPIELNGYRILVEKISTRTK